MNVLLDENLHRKLKQLFDKKFSVSTVSDQDWNGIKNGELLRAAQKEFDFFVTMDKGLHHQQNLKSVDLGIVVLRAFSNRLADTAPLIPEVCAALDSLKPGQVVTVGRV